MRWKLNLKIIKMPSLCVPIEEESGPESIRKMVDDKRVYPLLLHILHANCNNVKAAITLPITAQSQISPCSFDDLMLFLECHRLSRVPLGRREAGFYLNKTERTAMSGNNINLIAMKAVIAFNDAVPLFDQVIGSELLTLPAKLVWIARACHRFSPS